MMDKKLYGRFYKSIEIWICAGDGQQKECWQHKEEMTSKKFICSQSVY